MKERKKLKETERQKKLTERKKETERQKKLKERKKKERTYIPYHRTSTSEGKL